MQRQVVLVIQLPRVSPISNSDSARNFYFSESRSKMNDLNSSAFGFISYFSKLNKLFLFHVTLETHGAKGNQ